MSENNIYNGTFVLGDTSATTLSAGPGIKIDDSVPGVIKVSNDETVLWSGNAVNNDVLNLSENWNNFEYIGLEVYDIYGWGYNRTNCPTDMTSAAGNRVKRFAAGYDFVDNGNNQIYRRFYELFFPNGEYKTCSGYGRVIQITSGGNVSTLLDSAVKLSKIIGINRKQNGGN